ncbi:interleukin-6 receptor subunit beta-like isoform X2 [Acanthaster planci]|uniref:Interleukin-6 receptor subunit beta-like isoform X2 n=1 Tax=Acanthaster planci TaxID=133434 RepID=A0A8B7YL34_ACAPL|nr:interleukin-6 receptor subunit beta-like isoform X2 [Acanthaster planci]
MLCQQKNLHASPLCPTCWLHFLIVLCLTLSARGLHMAHAQATETVQIFPLEPTILAGTGFNLTCTVSHSSNVLAKDIAWNHNHMALPRTQFSAFDDKTSQLSVQDARFEDSGLYACFAQGISNETQVYVGEPPSEVRGLSCFSHNAWDITCSWERGKDTNLNTTYTLQYFPQHEIKNYENCPDEYCQCKDELTCTVHDRIHGPALFRVLSRNKLGYAISAELSFNHEEETVPYPPRNVQLKALRRSQLNVTWDLPPEWDPFYESALHYKVEYYKEGTTVLIRHPNSSNIAGKKYAILLPLPGSLDPYTTYCVRVAAKFSIGPWSEWSDTACNRTLEERPDAEVNVTWSSQINSRNDSLRDVLLKWEPLPQASARGEILGYRVIRANLSHESVTTLGPSKTSLEIPGELFSL